MWNPFRRSLVGKSAKEITGDVWMNSTSLPEDARQAVLLNAPLRFNAELAGVVTLIHFWDYSSPDSLDDLEHLPSWWEAYQGPHFVIIGVHTPQYEFAKDSDKVQAAALRFHLDYPVVSDPAYTTWKRYGNTVWPRKILVDAKGIIRVDHRGKGGHELLETTIHDLLEKSKEGHQFISPGNALTPPLPFDRESMGARGFALSPLTDPAEYHVPSKVPLHGIALSGWWIMKETELISGPLNDAQSCIVHFFGSSCVVSMRPVDELGATVQIFVDNKKVGEDIVVDEKKEYLVVSNLPAIAHHLTLIPTKGNIAISSISFS